LARAILSAASGEHPDGRVTLHRGNRIIADSDSAVGEFAKPSAAGSDG
jgi:hypothetical protein